MMVLGVGEGNMEIHLEKNSFMPGEIIKGKAVLKLENPKKAKELRVVIIAEREVYRNGSRRKEEVHRFSAILDREKEYRSSSYDFEITLPEMKEHKAPEGLLGDVVKAASALFGPSPIRWYLAAELDIPMSFDISKRMELNVVKLQSGSI
jgi:hypothetical protein